MEMQDTIKPKGKVEIFITQGKPKLILGKAINLKNRVFDSCFIDFTGTKMLDQKTVYNIIVNQSKDAIVSALAQGTLDPIGRMAIGDKGTIPSDSTVPKVPLATMTALFNEVYRQDIDATVLNVGTETVHEVKFVTTFSAVDVPIASFSNQAQPVVNEVALITFDETAGGGPLPRSPVAAPSVPPADEKVFSIRTFKSVPFEAANEIAVTIRYSIFIE